MLAIISGGSQGLGLSIGEEYNARGYDVVLVARTESKLKAAVSQIGGNTRYIVADVSIPSECVRVFKQLDSTPDIVLCCAGAARPGLFVDMSSDVLTSNLRTVYDTALYFSHAALKVMVAAGDKHEVRRRLVYCSSTVAIFPLFGYSAYAPAKAAIRSLADTVRQECIPHNISVSHIMPGNMDTEGFAQEELTKHAVTKEIEGPSAALPPSVVAKQVVRDLEKGRETIFTDTISCILGSTMMGLAPRSGFGILQSLAGILLILIGPIVRYVINNTIKKSMAKQATNSKKSN